MTRHDDTRTQVAIQYAKAVSTEKCCAKGQPALKGTLVKHAGYSEDELKSVPGDSVVNAYGCGNPLAYAGVREGKTVLDLGAGAGIDLILAAKRVGPAGRVIGIDMTEEMLAKSRSTAHDMNLDNVEFR